MKTVTFRGIRPTDENGRNALGNPERGLRYEMVIAHSPDDLCPWGRNWNFDKFPEDGVKLSQAYCYLTQYWNKQIAQCKLDALESEFAIARKAGVKFILRFAYEFDAYRLCPDMSRLKQHISQLQPVLERNWDVIYVIQCGWMGLWGEFHSCIRNIDHDIAACAEIIRDTINILPPDRFTMMRYPKKRYQVFREWGGATEINENNAFSQDLPAKVGFFNDGLLADPACGGTFINHPLKGAPGNPEFDFITHDAPYMPVEGELFWNHTCDAAYASAERVIERFRLHHQTSFSYVHGFSKLNGDPRDPVGSRGSIDFWKDTPLTLEQMTSRGYHCSPDYFNGVEYRTGFEFIRDHLGYRLEAIDASFTENTLPGSMFTAQIRIINRGFATMINPHSFYFVLMNERGEYLEIPTGFNGQKLQPYQPGDSLYTPIIHRISGSMRLPDDIKPGEWSLYLWIPDTRLRYRPEYAVRLASNTPWYERLGHGMNTLAKICIAVPETANISPSFCEEHVSVHYPTIPVFNDNQTENRPFTALNADFDNILVTGKTFHVGLTLNKESDARENCIMFFVLCHGNGQVYDFPADISKNQMSSLQLSGELPITDDMPQGAYSLGLCIHYQNTGETFQFEKASRLANPTSYWNIDGRGVNELGMIWHF